RRCIPFLAAASPLLCCLFNAADSSTPQACPTSRKHSLELTSGRSDSKKLASGLALRLPAARQVFCPRTSTPRQSAIGPAGSQTARPRNERLGCRLQFQLRTHWNTPLTERVLAAIQTPARNCSACHSGS